MCAQLLPSSCKLLFSGASGNSRQNSSFPPTLQLSIKTPTHSSAAWLPLHPPARPPACLGGDCPLSPAVRTAGGVMDGWMDGWRCFFLWGAEVRLSAETWQDSESDLEDSRRHFKSVAGEMQPKKASQKIS